MKYDELFKGSGNNVAKMPTKDSKHTPARKQASNFQTMVKVPATKGNNTKTNPVDPKKMTKTKNNLSKTFKPAIKIVHNRKEFPYGSAVSINGRDMDQQNGTIKMKPQHSLASYKIPTTTMVERQKELMKKQNHMLPSFYLATMSGMVQIC